ncbi:MAG: hypothetical protein QOJ07_374 [Thermoleophilaceae bacterium]|jgi:hypothetical protein|nr:hypothetical protein [Thermoleophilaceae bacterium]
MTPAEPETIEEIVLELEQTAARLREGRLEQDEAAALVERCADLANRVGGRLERDAREAAAGGGAPGQEQLL